MKRMILAALVLAVTAVTATPVVYIGRISSPDSSTPSYINKIQEVFEDVWSEQAVFENIDNVPTRNVSAFVQSLQLSDSDKVVTGSIMKLGSKQLLRIDVYNSDGMREHVSRRQISDISDIYVPMIETREEYYSPIQEQSQQILPSNNHQVGWSFTLGAGIKPQGYDYRISTPTGDTALEPHSLTLTDFAIVDAIGKYRNNILSLYFHYNWRADVGIGFGYSRIFMKQKPSSFTAGMEIGLNRMVIDNFMGEEEENYLGSQDGLMITPKIGVILFRDQKVNLFSDVAYSYVISERNAQYVSVRFGLISYWGRKRS